MPGLLYKEFVAVKGKRLLVVIAVILVLSCVLRVIFPGSMAESSDLLSSDDNKINLIDLFFALAYVMMISLTLSISDVWGAALADNDRDSSRIECYVRALPVSARDYIASKYIFVGVASYIMISVLTIIGIVFAAFSEPGIPQDLINMSNVMMVPFVSMILFFFSFGLPIYILFGKEKGRLVSTVFCIALALVVIGVALFGDMDAMSSENSGIVLFTQWYSSHQIEASLASYLSPIPVLALYYGSYRFTSYCHARREVGS